MTVGVIGSSGALPFSSSLCAAALTDLCLSGHLDDVDGAPRVTSSPAPDDPILRSMLETVRLERGDWAALVGGKSAIHRLVRDQLEADGLLRQRRSLLVRHFDPTHPATAEGLATSAAEALRRAVDRLPVEPLPLALGLLAEQAQLDTVLTGRESARLRTGLLDLIAAAIEPIVALQQVIAQHHDRVRSHSGAT
jgi:Golgi phosphoprotein 3 (GPP34)